MSVIEWRGITLQDMPADKVLQAAIGSVQQDELVIVGWDADKNLYLASTTSELPKVNWLLDVAKRELQRYE